MNSLSVFFSCLIFSILFTPYLITYLENIGVVDKPGERRINTRIIPRMGGLILYTVFTVITFVFYQDLKSVKLLILASFIIVICGIVDDMRGIKWYIKFPIQIVSAILLIMYFNERISIIYLFGINFQNPLNYFILLFFIVGVLNSINLMDGLDGLVTSYSMIVFSFILVLSLLKSDYFLTMTVLALLGSILGFLKYNSYPAKIFLGDTGSLFLGFYIVFTSLRISLDFYSNTLDLTFPVILLSIPVIDTLKVFTKRIVRKKNPFMPDKTHLHHVLLANNVKHKTTVFLILGLSLFFVFISLFYLKYRSLLSIILFISGSLLIIFMHPVMKSIRQIEFLKFLYSKFNNFPHIIGYLFDQCIIYAVIPPIAVLIYKNYPIKDFIPSSELYFLLIAVICIFILSIAHYSRTGIYNSVYVYFNINIFLFLNYFARPFDNVFARYYSIENILTVFSIIVISVFEIFFLVARGLIQNKKDMFFNGMDMTIIILTELVFILNSFIAADYLFTISCNLLIAFILFLMYKIIVFIKKDLKKNLFYLSYLLPLSVLIYALVIK